MSRLLQFRLLYISLFLLTAYAVSGSAIYAQASEPISLDAYREKLTTVSTLLTDPVDPAEALNQAEGLLADVRVRLPSGAIVVPQSLLTPPLSSTDERDDNEPINPDLLVTIALQRVQLSIQQIELSATDNTDVRLEALASVFERPEFSQSETLSQRFWNWISDLIDRFFPSNTEGGGLPIPGQLIAWAVVIIGGIGIVFALSYWLQRIFGSFVTDSTGRQHNVDGNGIPLTAMQARQQATQLAQSGNYREAVRSLYLSSLLSMEESGVIRYDRSLTNREVLNQVQARAATDGDAADGDAVEEHLRPVVETFDAVWYGVREPDVETFESYEQEIDGLATVVGKNSDGKQNPTTARNPAIRSRSE